MTRVRAHQGLERRAAIHAAILELLFTGNGWIPGCGS